MTLANWERVKSEASMGEAIVANRLRIDNLANSSTVARQFWHCRKNSSFSRGHIIGKIRTKVEVSQELGGDHDGFYGIMCMMSQADMTAGSGSCYCFGLYIDTAAEWIVNRYDFVSTSSSPKGSNSTLLGSGDTTLTPVVDTNYALELTWAYDTLIGGTRLLCKVGLAVNHFDDLVTVYDVTDSSGYLSASVGEGLFFLDSDGTVLDPKLAYYDDTEIVPLAGIPLNF